MLILAALADYFTGIKVYSFNIGLEFENNANYWLYIRTEYIKSAGQTINIYVRLLLEDQLLYN